MLTEKAPPHDADMERYVISCMVFDSDFAPEVLDILRPDDFYRPDNRESFKALAQLHAEGKPIEIISLKQELERNDLFDKIGGGEYLAGLASHTGTSVHARYYAQEIRRLSEARQIIKLVYDIIQKPELPTVEDLRRALEQAESNQYIKSYAEKSKQSISNFKKNLRVEKDKIKTGFHMLDKVIGGLRIPSATTIGAYPSVGKTAFALNIAAKQDKPVVFFSLEMSNEMIYERMAVAGLKLDYNLFSSQAFTDAEYTDIETYIDTLWERQFHVFDDVYYIEQQANIVASIKPALVVVDYVQKVRTHYRAEGRRVEVEYISGIYKQIAKDNECAVLILSQLARPAGGTNLRTFKPTMQSFKESGALEADSDYAMILHRPYVLCKDNPEEIKPENGYILVDKNKFGETGQQGLLFNGKYQTFYENDSFNPYAQAPPKNFFAEPEPDDEPLPFEV